MPTAKPGPLTGLPERLHYLNMAANLASGRSPQHAVDEALRIVNRVDSRLSFSGGNTVVALLGSTGSGKSSLFNAISGTNLAATGILRPTTSQAMAGVWAENMPDKLLEWLQVPSRQQISGNPQFTGLVLIDSPDHDSTLLDHRAQSDRLAERADSMIWVVDPQKYADNMLHQRYLKPLAQYAEVMLVVLNQIDLLPKEQRQPAIADLRRLLDAEGLSGAQLIAV